MLGILKHTWVPGTVAAADPDLIGMGKGLKVSEETPADETPGVPALEEPELLIPPEEDSTPEEPISGREPEGNGGFVNFELDMIRI